MKMKREHVNPPPSTNHWITDGRWSAKVNLLQVWCASTGQGFEHRADRFDVRCPYCNAKGSVRGLPLKIGQQENDG